MPADSSADGADSSADGADGSADGADGSADGACGATGRCQVEGGGACRGTDGKLATYVGPNASDTTTTEVSWWAGCA